MSQKFTLSRAKDPYEKWYAEINAAPWLNNETITNVNFTAIDDNGTDASTTFLDPAKCTHSTTVIKPYVRGGTDGVQYTIIMKVQTLQDPSYDVYVLIVNVKNIV